MKILEQSKQRLAFKTSGLVLAIVAAVFVFAGGCAIVASVAGLFDSPRLVVKGGRPVVAPPEPARLFSERNIPGFIGAVFAAVGLGIGLFGAGSITCTFDRASGDVTVDRKAILGSRSDTYRLKELTGADVESSESSDSDGRTYRAVLLFADGRRVPLGAIYTSNRRAHEAKAELVNAFLRGA